uniref:hypothetical protein n=1 Tax=Pseudomonas laurentiana TaxID=2364649 RepID=UPI0029C9B14C|nr:hypothetical protein [Pseudomonas laurentiana]
MFDRTPFHQVFEWYPSRVPGHPEEQAAAQGNTALITAQSENIRYKRIVMTLRRFLRLAEGHFQHWPTDYIYGQSLMIAAFSEIPSL